MYLVSEPHVSCSLCPNFVPASATPPTPAPALAAQEAPPSPAAQNAPPSPPPPAASPATPWCNPCSHDSVLPRHFADLATLSSSPIHLAHFAHKDPKGFKFAAKHPKWLDAMTEEMSALRLNDTWDLVPRPTASNVVGSKWVFRTKFQCDGSKGVNEPSIGYLDSTRYVESSSIRV
ncbi:hypothetical protein OSB04_012857 [Centaurea solstitialis]|uniref:Mitochondrial protein n=1 Tax=Centaurea solstitialis TaxID=347529 RepID=A0AA38TJM8_9ASTR|nr:hypothetical protein OSB04_012857 [Centaurea solstitialis]